MVELIDKNYMAFEESEYDVQNPEVILNLEFDFVVISILYANMRQEAKEELDRLGVTKKK